MNQNNSNEDRDLRQRDLIPPERLKQFDVTVVGVGAIGRQVALQLAALGVPKLQLIDHDVVETVNLAPQAYLERDVGRTKVEATAALCRELNSEIQITAHAERFRRRMDVSQIVFCCVDSIETRRMIWESVRHQIHLFVDGRMSAETLRVVTASDSASRGHYPTTLFPQQEAYAGSCTSKSTIYCANIAAGLMVSQYAKWLRWLQLEPDLLLNLLSNELTAEELATVG